MQRKCHACGATFTVHGDCQTKCELCTAGVSRDGRMVYGYVPPKEEKPKELPKGFRACEICGIVFKTSVATRKTCSYPCRMERDKRLKKSGAERQENIHEETCVVCGKHFITKRYNQLTCSDACSKGHRKKLMRENAKQKREQAKAVS